MRKHRAITTIEGLTATVEARLDEESPQAKHTMYDRLESIEETFERCPELWADEQIRYAMRDLSLALVMRRNRQPAGSGERQRTSRIMERVHDLIPAGPVHPAVVREKLRGILREAEAMMESEAGDSSVYTLPELLEISELSARLSRLRQAGAKDAGGEAPPRDEQEEESPDPPFLHCTFVVPSAVTSEWRI